MKKLVWCVALWTCVVTVRAEGLPEFRLQVDAREQLAGLRRAAAREPDVQGVPVAAAEQGVSRRRHDLTVRCLYTEWLESDGGYVGRPGKGTRKVVVEVVSSPQPFGAWKERREVSRGACGPSVALPADFAKRSWRRRYVVHEPCKYTSWADGGEGVPVAMGGEGIRTVTIEVSGEPQPYGSAVSEREVSRGECRSLD